MSNVENFSGYRYLFLVRVTDRDLYPGLGEYGVVYSVDGSEEGAPDGAQLVARTELTSPMTDPAATRWLAESDAALEWLVDAIGREDAEQLREETRDSPFYPE